MARSCKLITTAAGAGSLLLTMSMAGAAPISVPYVNSGGFIHQFSGSGTLATQHFESPQGEHESYFLGNTNVTAGGGFNYERRPYLVFDASAVTGPISSATLRMWIWQVATANGNNGGYVSADATETLTLHSVDNYTATQVSTAPYNVILSPLDLAIWTDLGDGAILGSRVFSVADISTDLVPSPTTDPQTICGQVNSACGKWVDIPLNAAAIAEILAADGDWIVGGFLSTIGPNPGGKEWLFAGTLVDLDPGKSAYPDFLTPPPQLLLEIADADADGVGDAADNCPNTANPNQADTDGDLRGNMCDNCRTIANNTGAGAQCNSDGDAFGNRCDADFGNPPPGNGFTNSQDTALFRAQLGLPSVPPTYNRADLNCNGTVNSQDTILFRGLLGLPPGPGAGP